MGNKVLVVDDESSICDLVRIALMNKGMDVRVANTGEDGIEAFKEFMPDVILLDYRLPDLVGHDVARKIKELEAGKKTHIITMSGEDSAEVEITGALFSGKLKKPFKLADMVEYVEKCLKK